jgi:sialate O-acetylesterase
LTAKGGKVIGFAVAGTDHKFYWAAGRIEGSTVVLTCPQVPKPVAVRYGWSANPPVCLYNSAGLPASPFRTDTWKGVTADAK